MELLYLCIVMLWMPVSLGILLGEKVERKMKWKSFSSLFLIMIIVSLIVSDERGMLLIMILEVFMIRFVLKLPWINVLYIFVSYIEIVVCEVLVQVLLIDILNIYTNEHILEFSPYREFYTIGILLLISLLSILLRRIIEKYQKHIFIISREVIFLSIIDVVVCTIVFLILNWTNRKLEIPEVNSVITVCMGVYIIFTFIITVVIYKFAKEKAQIAQEKKMQEELQEYTKQIERMYNNLRSFKHDYVNILMALNGYMEEKDYVGMEKYFKEHILPTNHKLNSENFRLSQLSNIKESALKGLVSSKLIYAHEMGVDVYLDIMEPIEKFSMNLLDLTRVLGIYLDNAIDATIECDRKEIKFNIIDEEKSTTIILMNTFDDKGIQLEQLGIRSYSTKGEERGIGLYNVKDILRKHRNVFKETAIKDGYFIQTLILEK